MIPPPYEPVTASPESQADSAVSQANKGTDADITVLTNTEIAVEEGATSVKEVDSDDAKDNSTEGNFVTNTLIPVI